jgi:broad specificity phosphatase PhoE
MRTQKAEERSILKLILVRHGETSWNEQKKIQGASDIELNDRGCEQVRKLALSLREEKIDVIVTSPLKRAYETARAIGRFHDVTIEAEKDLQELNTGDLEGLTFPEVMAKYPTFLQQWRADSSAIDIPNGESFRSLQNRAWPVIERIINRARNAVVISHNFTLAAILCKIQNLDISRVTGIHFGMASKTLVEIAGGKAAVVSFNQTDHLQGL